jgi:hypothetical protein
VLWEELMMPRPRMRCDVVVALAHSLAVPAITATQNRDHIVESRRQAKGYLRAQDFGKSRSSRFRWRFPWSMIVANFFR